MTGSYGRVATHAGDLFSASTYVWNIGAGLLQPIFHGGALLHERRAAIAAYEEAAAQYRRTVLAAFPERRRCPARPGTRCRRPDARSHWRKRPPRTVSISRTNSSRTGPSAIYLLLNAQQAYQQAQIGLVQAQASRYADTAALFQALGGGWWNRDDVASGSATTRSRAR